MLTVCHGMSRYVAVKLTLNEGISFSLMNTDSTHNKLLTDVYRY